MSNRKKLHSNFYQTATTTKGMIEKKKRLHKNTLKKFDNFMQEPPKF